MALQRWLEPLFFNDPAPPEVYTLSLHDALPISPRCASSARRSARGRGARSPTSTGATTSSTWRSEEHTSELQSQSNIVCRLLLEKKKKPRGTRRRRPPRAAATRSQCGVHRGILG